MSCCCFRTVSALLVRRNHVGAEGGYRGSQAKWVT